MWTTVFCPDAYRLERRFAAADVHAEHVSWPGRAAQTMQVISELNCEPGETISATYMYACLMSAVLVMVTSMVFTKRQ